MQLSITARLVGGYIRFVGYMQYHSLGHSLPWNSDHRMCSYASESSSTGRSLICYSLMTAASFVQYESPWRRWVRLAIPTLRKCPGYSFLSAVWHLEPLCNTILQALNGARLVTSRTTIDCHGCLILFFVRPEKWTRNPFSYWMVFEIENM